MGLAAITRTKQAHEFQTPGTATDHDDLRLSLSHVIPPPARYADHYAYQGLARELNPQLGRYAA
jgi:hypothetical protein